MSELKAEQIKKELEGLAKFRTCPEYIKNALALINSQEQRIKELTEELVKCYTDKAKLTEENAYIKHIELEAMRSEANYYKMHSTELAEENERLRDTAYRLESEVLREKADTVRKMQERLKKWFGDDLQRVYSNYNIHRYIDGIAKEMLEGG